MIYIVYISRQRRSLASDLEQEAQRLVARAYQPEALQIIIHEEIAIRPLRSGPDRFRSRHIRAPLAINDDACLADNTTPHRDKRPVLLYEYIQGQSFSPNYGRQREARGPKSWSSYILLINWKLSLSCPLRAKAPKIVNFEI